MKRFCVLVAAEKYSHFPPTHYCHEDARLLRTVLLDHYDFAEQDILMMLLDPDTECSPADVLAQIQGVVNRSTPGDTVLFFFAGHGDYHNGESYLILPTTDPSNRVQTALPLRDISTLLREPGRLSIRLFDACHSGSDVRGPEAAPHAGEFTRSVLADTHEGWVTLAGCRANEYSHGDPALGNGVFTRALADTLLEDVGAGEDSFPEQLKLGVCRRVATWCSNSGKHQTPTMNSSISGNIVFARRKVATVPARPTAPTPPPSELSVRLSAVRRFPAIRSDAHVEQLGGLADAAAKALALQRGTIQSFGAELEFEAPAGVAKVPGEFRPTIVSLVSELQVRPLHTVRSYTEEPDFSARLLGAKATVLYDLSQPDSLPPSYTALRLATDGFVPNSIAFVYLCPLQVRVLAICGVALGGVTSAKFPSWTRPSLRHCFLDFDAEDASRLGRLAMEAVQLLNPLVEKAIADRLEYLEFEATRE